MFATRPTLSGPRHAVSAGHYLAATAGIAVLEAGGNAVDAGCAAGIALGVLLPDLVNVAGVAPIMVRMADGTVETIAGLGHWPRALPPDVFMREHGGEIPAGVRRTVVPAAPDAWITALERHGTMASATSRNTRSAMRGRASPSIRCWPRRSPRMRPNTRNTRPTPRSSCRAGRRPGSATVSCSRTSRGPCPS